MPGTPTSRLGLPVIDGDVDYVNTGDDVINTITSLVEAGAVWYLRGPASSRPAASVGTPYKLATIYEATDTGALSWSAGASWLELNAATTLLDQKGFSLRSDMAWPPVGVEVGRFPISQACTLDSAQHVFASGSATKFAWQRSTGGGAFANITGLNNIGPTTTKATIASGLALLAGDDLRLMVTQQGDAKGGFAMAILRDVT